MPTPPPFMIVAGGVFLLLVVVFQMLVGYRKIKFKGPKHLKVHKRVAWALVVVSVLHAVGGMLYLGFIPGL